MGKQKTHEQFCKEVYDLVGDEYIVLGKYDKARIHILIKHNIPTCQHEWEITPDHFLNGRRCPIHRWEIVGDKRRKTQDQFEKELFYKFGSEYVVLGKYINDNTNILIKHKCGHEWSPIPGSLLGGRGCPICNLNKGEKHYNWQGGKSELIMWLRRQSAFWKKESMKYCNYKCVITNQRFDDIHHLFNFSKIVRESLNELSLMFKNYLSDYSQEELLSIEKLVNKKQLQLLGVCLTREIHEEFHKIYGYKNFAPEDFYEFYKIKTGKEFIPVYKQFEIA